jgi:membrane protease YdiL (CAAX protease family)
VETEPTSTVDTSPAPFDRMTGRMIGLLTLVGALPGCLLLLLYRPLEVAMVIAPPAIYGGVAIALLAGAPAMGVDLRRIFGRALTWREIGFAMGLAITILAFSFGTLIAGLAAVSLAQPQFLEQISQNAPGFLVHANGRVELWSTLLGAATGALLAPVVEELVFRGFLFTRWARRFGLVRGLAFSALLFGLLHLSLQPLGALTLGFMAGLLYLRTRSLWSPIVAHLTNNLIVVTASTLGQHAGDPSRLVPGPGELRNLLLGGIGLVLVSVPLLVLALRNLWPAPGTKPPYDDPTGRS